MTKIISSTRGWTFKTTYNITCSLTGSKSPNRRKKKNHKALIISRLFPDPMPPMPHYGPCRNKICPTRVCGADFLAPVWRPVKTAEGRGGSGGCATRKNGASGTEKPGAFASGFSRASGGTRTRTAVSGQGIFLLLWLSPPADGDRQRL